MFNKYNRELVEQGISRFQVISIHIKIEITLDLFFTNIQIMEEM